jgi:hypothetical protein
MNASQLLEVATKVFVNQDHEAKWEANRKMKEKVDLLAAALAGQSDGPQQGRGRSNPREQDAPRMPLP